MMDGGGGGEGEKIKKKKKKRSMMENEPSASKLDQHNRSIQSILSEYKASMRSAIMMLL